MRNPKDMLVSFYYFYKMNKVLGWFGKSWDDFFQLFRHKKLVYGDWLDHVESYSKSCANKNNVLFVHYEDAKANQEAVIKRMADFLQIPLDDEVIKKISAHVEFENMKSNPMTNFKEAAASGFFKEHNFIRQGLVGGWKNYFTVAQNEYMDEVYMVDVKQLGITMKDSF